MDDELQFQVSSDSLSDSQIKTYSPYNHCLSGVSNVEGDVSSPVLRELVRSIVRKDGCGVNGGRKSNIYMCERLEILNRVDSF